MDLFQEALDIAIKAHKGQFDKGGTEYINHPVYVMSLFDKEQLKLKIIALLHDVIEDTNYITLEEIKSKFGNEIASAIDAISRRDGETYNEYIDRLLENESAMFVKVADITHNCSMYRGYYSESMIKRYESTARKIADKLGIVI